MDREACWAYSPWVRREVDATELFSATKKNHTPPSPLYLFSSVHSLSHVQLCDTMDCSTPDFPVHHQLLELAETHVN